MVVLLVLASIDVWQFVIPMNTQIEQLKKSVADLQAQIKVNDEKIRNLDKLKAEVVEYQRQLKDLTEQLPPESEVSGLLRQIQDRVNQSGLVLKLWKPDKPRDHASGLYREIPVNLSLTGGYHNVATFFDRVSKLSRIVNILNIKMATPKVNNDGTLSIEVNCTAMTFSALEKKVETKPATGKKVK
ncbi:MAG: type 4a pilus biogenesis protein PilO [Nitrospirota bacterium]